MPTASPSRPFVVFQHFDADADLGRQMPDDRRSKIGLIVRKAAVPPPIHELYGKPELACVGHPRKPRQILGSESPVLSNLSIERAASLRPVPSVQTTDSTRLWSPQLGHFAQLRGHWALFDRPEARSNRPEGAGFGTPFVPTASDERHAQRRSRGTWNKWRGPASGGDAALVGVAVDLPSDAGRKPFMPRKPLDGREHGARLDGAGRVFHAKQKSAPLGAPF